MNGERPPQDAQCYRDELLRLACDEGDTAPASPELPDVLADDTDTRAEFAETRELVNELRSVLRPEPLPEALARRIARQLDAQTVGRRTLILRQLRVGGLAAAAALLLAVIGPWNLRTTSVVLSEQDAASIVAAWEDTSWTGYLDYSLERVSDELDDIEQRIDRESGLPWGPEDDWDLSGDDRGTSLQGRVSPVCRIHDAGPNTDCERTVTGEPT